jgi:hypothetical protein
MSSASGPGPRTAQHSTSQSTRPGSILSGLEQDPVSLLSQHRLLLIEPGDYSPSSPQALDLSLKSGDR